MDDLGSFMLMMIFGFLAAVALILIVGIEYSKRKVAAMSPSERTEYERDTQMRQDERTYGFENANLICPHCQTKGKVRTKQVDQKAGISGGKATGAVLTLGWSLLATGLWRKQKVTVAHCDNGSSTWHF